MNKVQDIKMRILGENAASAAFRQVSNDLTGLTRRAGLAGTAFKALGSVAIGAVAVQGIRKMIGVVTESIELAQVQMDAEKKVADIIRATGGAAGYTTEELKKMASAMQEQTKYGDEAILNMQSILLTFKNVSGSTFREASMAVLDMATVMQTDLKSAAIQLGKALNDPVLGATAMSRAGIQFTQSQKDVMKAMVETGNIAGAQRIILDELAGQMGGAAAGAAETYSGKIQQLKNRYGDMQEEIGKAVMESGAFDMVLRTLNPAVNELTAYFADHKDDIGEFAKGLTESAIGAGKLAVELGKIASVIAKNPAIIGMLTGAWMGKRFGTYGMLTGAVVGAVGGETYKWAHNDNAADLKALQEKAREGQRGIMSVDEFIAATSSDEMTVQATIKPVATGSTATTVTASPTPSTPKGKTGSSVVAAATGKGLPTTSDFDRVIESLKDEERQLTMTSQEYKTYLAIKQAGVAEGSKEAEAIRQAIADNEELRQKYEDLGTFFESAQAKQDGFLTDLHEGVSQWIGSLDYMFNDMVWGAEVAFDDILKNFAQMITQMIIRSAIVKPMQGFFDGIFSANGNVFGPSGLVPFARGGVVTRPTIFPFANGVGVMGEAGPEAIMPLKRGADGRLGVEAGGGNAVNVQVQVVNQTGQKISERTETKFDGRDYVITTFLEAVGNNTNGAREGLKAMLAT